MRGGTNHLNYHKLYLLFPYVAASLADLRELKLESISMADNEINQIAERSIVAFGDRQYGASTDRPWPQLGSISIQRSSDVSRVLLHGLSLRCTDGWITSLSLLMPLCSHNYFYYPCVRPLFEALNDENTCPHLKELNITSCELVTWIACSLATPENRQRQESVKRRSSAPIRYPEAAANYNFHNHNNESRLIIDWIFNDLMAYVLKRQSAVQHGKPFLRSLLIIAPTNTCHPCNSIILLSLRFTEKLYVKFSFSLWKITLIFSGKKCATQYSCYSINVTGWKYAIYFFILMIKLYFLDYRLWTWIVCTTKWLIPITKRVRN